MLVEYLAEYLADARVRLKPQTVDYLERTFRNVVLPTLADSRLDQIDMTALAGTHSPERIP